MDFVKEKHLQYKSFFMVRGLIFEWSHLRLFSFIFTLMWKYYHNSTYFISTDLPPLEVMPLCLWSSAQCGDELALPVSLSLWEVVSPSEGCFASQRKQLSFWYGKSSYSSLFISSAVNYTSIQMQPMNLITFKAPLLHILSFCKNCMYLKAKQEVCWLMKTAIFT